MKAWNKMLMIIFKKTTNLIINFIKKKKNLIKLKIKLVFF